MLQTSAGSSANWKRVLGGLVAACLLLPVPAFAVIDFSGVTWTYSPSSGTNKFFSSVTSTSTSTDTLLTFTLAAGQTLPQSETDTVTSSVITAGSGDTIKSNWANLGSMQVTGGSVGVTITITNGTPGGTGNMFSQTYTTTSEPPYSPATTPIGSFTANPVITVVFTGSKLASINSGTSPSTQFTLDFLNGP